MCRLSAWLLLIVASLAGFSNPTPARAAEGDDSSIDVGRLVFTAPEGWTRKEPASKIIAYEFAIAPADGDKLPGRLTVMAAGGSVEANVERWHGQFAQPDGSDTAKRAKQEKIDVAGFEGHLVDISGTYHDRPSPREAAVDRENFRMLGAIVVTDQGTFYLKFYGPEKTIAAQEKAFRAMVEGAKKPQ